MRREACGFSLAEDLFVKGRSKRTLHRGGGSHHSPGQPDLCGGNSSIHAGRQCRERLFLPLELPALCSGLGVASVSVGVE